MENKYAITFIDSFPSDLSGENCCWLRSSKLQNISPYLKRLLSVATLMRNYVVLGFRNNPRAPLFFDIFLIFCFYFICFYFRFILGFTGKIHQIPALTSLSFLGFFLFHCLRKCPLDIFQHFRERGHKWHLHAEQLWRLQE